jgi:hypothetical protein
MANLPSYDHMMLLMPILPMMLIGTILVATALDGRGLLGPRDRRVGMTVPLAAIASGLSLAAAAIHFSYIGGSLAQDRLLGIYTFGVGWVQAVWALAYVHSRSAAVALVGAAVNAIVLGVAMVSHLGGVAVGLPDLFAASFEFGLIVVLLAKIAPSLEEQLAKREMKAQRAFVLTTFCVSVVTLMTSVALFS